MNNILAAQPGEYVKGNIVANVSGAKALTSIFGDKVVFKPVGEATQAQPAPAAEEPRKIEAKAVSGPSRIEGVTVGMAVNKAVDILVARNEHIGADDVWQTASMLIRVAQKLQEGYLAPVMATNEVPSEEVPF